MAHRFGGMRTEAVGITGDFGSASHADPVTKPGDRDLVGFIHDG